jgi:hypothetical protein
VWPALIPFAVVMTSGVTSQCSIAKFSPVRPIPDITSSATNSTSYSSQSSRTIGKYSAPGVTAAFAAPTTGSAMNAETYSGPTSRMTVSSSFAHSAPRARHVSASGQNRQRYG